MSSQRVRGWDEPSYTVPATAMSVAFHPSGPKLQRVSGAKHAPGHAYAYRRVPGHAYRKLSIRECARIQGFPDDFRLVYERVTKGHKMVGNAVPPPLARAVAGAVLAALAAPR